MSAKNNSNSSPNSEKQLRNILKQNIRHYRAVRKLTQQELANAADLSVAYIGGIEIGIKSPSLQSLSAIAAALEVQVYQLLLPPSDKSDVQVFCRELLQEFPRLLEQLKGSSKGNSKGK